MIDPLPCRCMWGITCLQHRYTEVRFTCCTRDARRPGRWSGDRSRRRAARCPRCGTRCPRARAGPPPRRYIRRTSSSLATSAAMNSLAGLRRGLLAGSPRRCRRPPPGPPRRRACGRWPGRSRCARAGDDRDPILQALLHGLALFLCRYEDVLGLGERASGASGPSLPGRRPDCLKPPNGVQYRTDECEFTDRLPVSTPCRGHPDRAAHVGGPDRPGKPVGGVVGDTNRLRLVSERRHGHDRPEHLLGIRAIIETHGREHGRRVPEPGPGRARKARGTRRARRPVRRRPRVPGAPPRSASPISVAADAGSPTATPLHRGFEQLHEAVDEDRALDQDPRPRAAVLPGVVEHRVRRGRTRPAPGRRRRR